MKKTTEKTRIGQLLVEQGLITHKQLDEALHCQRKEGGKTVQHLLSLGYLSRHALERFLAQQGTPSIDLTSCRISKSTLATVPREFAEKHEVFPIDRMGNSLTVGMAFPLDETTRAEMERMTGLRVRPVLCSDGDLYAAIRRYYRPEEAMVLKVDELLWNRPDRSQAAPRQEREAPVAGSGLKIENIAGLIRKIKMLPPLPRSVQIIQKALEGDQICMGEVADTIRDDPAICVKILSTVNSAAYGLRHDIVSIDHAVSLLGLKELSRIAVGESAAAYFKKHGQRDYTEFWKYSRFCAYACAAIARLTGAKERGLYYTLGLVHDIGRLVLSETVPSLYEEIDTSRASDRLAESEQEVIGIAHPEAGYLLACAWGLPEELIEPIRFHHHPDRASHSEELVTALRLAGSLYHDPIEESGDEGKPDSEHAAAMERLGMSEETVETLREILLALRERDEDSATGQGQACQR